ncbi:MAG: hypothetical protein ACD_75C00048G0006 [uncultured bacterium]|nr:MAG: hypothetical protein ACD_75C00048G0006 [uncultured bacterium]
MMQRLMLRDEALHLKSSVNVILRHADLSTTERYLGKVNDTEAIRWIEAFFGEICLCEYRYYWSRSRPVAFTTVKLLWEVVQTEMEIEIAIEIAIGLGIGIEFCISESQGIFISSTRSYPRCSFAG